MHTQRLKQMIELLENYETLIPNVKFDIELWQSKHKCGTSACAMGLATMYKPFQDQGLHWNGVQPVFEHYLGFRAAQAFFDIEYHQASHLFSESSYDLAVVKPSDVIERIKELLQ